MAAKKKPKFRLVTIYGNDDVKPWVVHLKPADRLSFVNPNGEPFKIKFKGKSPLSKAVGSVSAYSPSKSWYKLSSKAVRGKHYHYSVKPSGPSRPGTGPGGPEIVPDG
jgi:hypothetical protein